MKQKTDQHVADKTVEDLLARIAREGVYTSEKESRDVSWRVIFDGLRFLEQPRERTEEDES